MFEMFRYKVYKNTLMVPFASTLGSVYLIKQTALLCQNGRISLPPALSVLQESIYI